jgi:uncharacterized protein YcbX
MRSVAALWRYPLKSARGELLDEAGIEPTGLAGDRTWACIDGADGTVGSAKHPRRWGKLLAVRATLTRSGLTVHLDGEAVRAGTAEADAALSDHLGRPARFTHDLPARPTLHRMTPDEPGLIATWNTGVRPGEETVSEVGGVARVGRFTDFGAVHVVTTGALARLRTHLGGAPADAERFRPNLVLDAPDDPGPGEELRLGDVVLRVNLPTPRCVIPGLAHAGLPPDRALLSTLARHYRIEVGDLGRAACFGFYADVVRPGRVRVGQTVR